MRRLEIDTYFEKIIILYNNGETIQNISNIFGSNKKSISRVLKNNGVEIKRYKRKYEKYYHQRLNSFQKELIIGSLLGDGCISKHHEGVNSCRFIESHSIAQKEYLNFKYNLLRNFISSEIRYINNEKTKSYGNKPTLCFVTVLHKEFVNFYELFYNNRKKVIPSNIKSLLTPFGLAIWYMDDGSYDKNNSYGIVRFSTHSFSEHCIDILQKCLKDNFDLFSTKVYTSKGIVIQLSQNNSKKLFKIITPFIIPTMSYKINFSDSPVETEENISEGFVSEMIQGQDVRLSHCL